ncbi:haloacid dehalogenase type II [Xanthobacter sp. AM11]|uniref:haloacid dehalogenase type II n=1 Tax=Xanthobacter sp. AM11 TaxID=3380643 RepID=UPI0039BFE50B
MMAGRKPEWLTFDCYGTLIQWDEGLLAAVEAILARQGASAVDAATLIHTYDKYEHALEEERPHRNFRTVAGEGLRRAMEELGLAYTASDIEILTGSISRMPPFPEVVDALGALKAQGFRLCIVSNTDDDIIAGNVAQLGGHVDRVITAEQAQAYKPSRQIFEHAHRALGVAKEDIVHICASPHLDLAAARDMGFRCIWIDRGTGRKPLPDYSPEAVFATLDRVPGYFGTLGWA